jgi:hypothetical protein
LHLKGNREPTRVLVGERASTSPNTFVAQQSRSLTTEPLTLPMAGPHPGHNRRIVASFDDTVAVV